MSLIDTTELRADLCRKSFYQFLLTFWPEVCKEDLHDNWHIKYLCDEMQIVAERVFAGEAKEYDLVINISPGSTKSTICTRMFPAWVWTRMVEARLICASYTHDLALSLGLSNRRLIDSDTYKLLFPEVQPSPDQWSKTAFQNTEGGERRAVGVGGAITGFHGHFIIIDDPLNPKGAMSEAELITANEWMSETIPSRKVDKKITPTILIMQRLHQDDPSANMLKREDVKHIKLPAEIVGKASEAVRPLCLVRHYSDGLMDTVRLDRKVLKEQEATLGQYGYAGQFLQTPIPAGGGMFKPERLKIQLCELRPHEWDGMHVRYWDKAGTTGGGAFTVGAKIGRDVEGRFWILDIVREQLDAHERNALTKKTANADGFNVVVGIEQEPGSGGKESAQTTVKQLAGYHVTVDIPTGNKVLRADPFSVQVNQGNVYMVPAPWNEALVSEMRHFPHSKYKDQIDALSAAFSLLVRGASMEFGVLI